MKKIIILLSLFLMCYCCYYIYNKTKINTLYISTIGDTKISCIKSNIEFINKDYRIIDLLNTIKYNEEKEDSHVSIHQILKKTDILIISIGTNDIYYKLDSNTKEIYTYLNKIINTYEELLNEISKYSYDKVYIIGYSNKYDKYNDLFNYINYKLKVITNKYNYTYINPNNSEYNKICNL